jgi:hypothetical protein
MREEGVERLAPMREGVPVGEPSLQNALREELEDRICPEDVVVTDGGGAEEQNRPQKTEQGDHAGESHHALEENRGLP